MPQSVKLSDELIKQARHYGDVYHRSTAKQIEYWSTIGKISEENPDLPYSFIKDILLAQREVLSGDVTLMILDKHESPPDSAVCESR